MTPPHFFFFFGAHAQVTKNACSRACDDEVPKKSLFFIPLRGDYVEMWSICTCILFSRSVQRECICVEQ